MCADVAYELSKKNSWVVESIEDVDAWIEAIRQGPARTSVPVNKLGEYLRPGRQTKRMASFGRIRKLLRRTVPLV